MGTAVPPIQPRWLDRLDHVFVDHDLKAAALWANLRAQLRGRRGCRWLWIGERELRAKRMRVRARNADYWLPFLPDGYFEVSYSNGDVQACLVEIDMGTLTLRRFARKVQAFETALEDEVFCRHLKRDDFAVLVLTQSRRRAEALRHVASRVVPGDRLLPTPSTKRCCRRRSPVRPGGISTARHAPGCSSMRKRVKHRAEPIGSERQLRMEELVRDATRDGPDLEARAAAVSEIASILGAAARQLLNETAEQDRRHG
jgi:hypothetical protein